MPAAIILLVLRSLKAKKFSDNNPCIAFLFGEVNNTGERPSTNIIMNIWL